MRVPNCFRQCLANTLFIHSCICAGLHTNAKGGCACCQACDKHGQTFLHAPQSGQPISSDMPESTCGSEHRVASAAPRARAQAVLLPNRTQIRLQGSGDLREPECMHGQSFVPHRKCVATRWMTSDVRVSALSMDGATRAACSRTIMHQRMTCEGMHGFYRTNVEVGCDGS